MIVEPKVHRDMALQVVGLQVFGLGVTAYAFLLPWPVSTQIFAALVISLGMAALGYLQEYIDLSQQQIGANAWFNELTLREGLNQHAGRGPPLEIDWRAASIAARDDIKAAKADAAMTDQLSAGTVISISVYVLLGWPLSMLARPALGWAIAYGLKLHLPKLVALIAP